MRLKLLIEEMTFFDRFKQKNKWMELFRTDKEKLKKELYVLVANAYAPLGGHVRISNIDKVLDSELTYWEGIDDDADRESDAVLFGKKTKFGIKVSGIGHDGQRQSKSDLMNKMVDQFKKPGYWIEVSDRLAEVLIGKGAPFVDKKETVEKIFNQPIQWLNDKGWYIRTVNDEGLKSKEIIIGTPNT